jgi:glutamate decarboxylase
LLKGIEQADSVTIDAHKQLYVPIGAGLVLFKNPQISGAIEHHAKYILREGSKDIGIHTLEGSRPGMAMLVHSCLNIIGRQGYELLIDKSLANARYFAELINSDDDFELISEPELCLLTYRYVPGHVRRFLEGANKEVQQHINGLLNVLTRTIQKTQREQGKSFVSRTMLNPIKYHAEDIIVFRVVLANPLTTPEILQAVLAEQKAIARKQLAELAPIEQIVASAT